MKIICSINLDIRNKFIIIVQDYGKQKKQLLDAMKALPMTMEDKCAFVDLISQNSNGGGIGQEDEYLYFDVRDIDETMVEGFLRNSPYIIISINNKILETTGIYYEWNLGELVKIPIAIKAKKYICMIIDSDNSGFNLIYIKVNTIDAMNYIGAKQITKEEYNSFINFTIDDFEEVFIG